MKKLTRKQLDFVALLPLNHSWVQVATSQYSIDSIQGQWNPVTYYTPAGLRGLARRGIIDLDLFWRGANVRLKK